MIARIFLEELLDMDYKKLQNGSDIRGVAIEGVAGEDVNLSNEAAGDIALAFAVWLAGRLQKDVKALRVCVGRDSRLSGESLSAAVTSAIADTGACVFDAGLATTPAMFMSTVMPGYDMDGAIMITASHLPFNRNGMKFFTADGGLDKEDISDILALAEKADEIRPNNKEENRRISESDLMEAYASYLRGLITSSLDDRADCLKDMHIVVDAGNGTSGFFATEVLAPLGADISGSQYLEPDGNFPNHAPNPEDAEAMKAICHAVDESKADLGIIFDTDGDRASAVAPGGIAIARNEIIALAAALKAKENPGGIVVTDSITSDELTDFLEKKLGLKHFRYRRGYRNVIKKAKELCETGRNAFLAIETSGHAAYAENYFLDDGAYLAVQAVISAARLKAKGADIMSLIKDLKSPAESLEIRYKIRREDYASYAAGILEDMEKWAEETEGLELVKPNYEGVRVNYALEGYTGWFLFRKSLHDPVMPLNIESAREGGIDKALDLISAFMQNYKDVEK